ncbi:hypothetical protein [Paraburkholderia tropica]|uniref:hypothetical protein n=1 Tax=Paraburkholderia tropica TaxID=92647 RepID=UPI002AB12FD9|nr:hypothetical protein [Paraburkholderia tropica]
MHAPRRPSLVDDAEIERIVRAYAARVAFLRAAFHAGEAGAENPLEVIERDAHELSAALKLTPHGKALWRVLLPDETIHMGDPGAALGLWLAAQVAAAAKAIEDGEPEDDVKPRIDALLADLVARLTGRKY